MRLLRCVPILRRLALCLALVGHEAAAATTFSVLGYNIERGIGSSSSATAGQSDLAQVVNQLSPDVWTINELGGFSAGFSRNAAFTYIDSFVASYLTIFGTNPRRGVNYFVSIGTHNDGYTTNAIISRYPILESQSYSDAGGGYGSLRGLTYALIDVPGATDVGVFTMHLKASSDTDSAAQRQAQAEANKATLSGWMSLHPKNGLVVTGDWNSSRDADDPSNWSSHDVGDSITLDNGTITTYDPVGTLLSAGLTDPMPRSISGDKDTHSSTSPTRRYDYIAYDNLTYSSGLVFDTDAYSTSALATMNARAGTALTAATTGNASDHLPVFATFVIVPEPGTVLLVALGLGVVVVAMRRRA